MSEEKPNDVHTVQVDPSNVSASDEAGTVYRFECPMCDLLIRWAQYGWWGTTCKCGLKWEVEITAVGRPAKEGE